MAKSPFQEPVTDSVAKINEEVAVGEDLRFQRRWWRFERGVWLLFILLIVLDVAGVFGRGPIAQAEANSASHSLEVTYERIERTGTPSMMTVKVNRMQGTGNAVELFLSDAAVSGLGLRRVIPAPAITTIGNGGLTYRFPSGLLPADVRFEFQPVGAGVYQVALSTPGEAPIKLTVAVVP